VSTQEPTGHDFCPFGDPKFQLKVIEGLAKLHTEATATNVHLASLNGAVGRHTKELGELQIWKAAQVAEETTSKAWLKATGPIAGGVIGIVLVLLCALALLHAPELLKLKSP
jgi:hypothetical protein